MKAQKLLIAVCLVFAACYAAAGQTNVFDGNAAIVAAGATGGNYAVTYSSTVSVKRASGAGSITINNCSGTPIGSVSTSTSQSLTSGNGGLIGSYFCFVGSDANFKVTIGSTTYDYWFPKSNTTGFYNVMDFGATGNGTLDDTAAIKNAVTFIAAHEGGTLYFPQGVFVVGESADTEPITLPPGIVIQGVTGLSPGMIHNYYSGSLRSKLLIKSASRTIFRIGEGSSDIKIKNIALDSVSSSGTIGIHAVGRSSSSRTTTTVDIGLDDVTFHNFEIGFHAHDYPGDNSDSDNSWWQFDHIKLDHCYFLANKNAGIKIDSYNTDWRIASTQFAVLGSGGGDNDGLVIAKAGNVMVENSFGAATSGTGGDFIDVELLAALTVINSESEGMAHSILYGNSAGNSGGANQMLTLVNNLFGDPLTIRTSCTFTSTGNNYLGKNVSTVAGVKIFSTGDRFCRDPSQVSVGSSWACGPVESPFDNNAGFQGGGKIMFQTGQDYAAGNLGANANNFINAIPTSVGNTLAIKTDDYTEPLIRLGQGATSTNYTVSRDVQGWLSFVGPPRTVSGSPFPYRGFRFDAPVEPPSYDYADLPTGTPGNGSMVFCANCKRNTNPCSTTGSGPDGAPAILVNAVWECK